MLTAGERIDRLENVMIELADAQMRTQASLKKFSDETQLSLKKLSDEMQDFKDEMREFKDEMREFKDEMQEFKDEMREFKEEARADRKQMKRPSKILCKLDTQISDSADPFFIYTKSQTIPFREVSNGR